MEFADKQKEYIQMLEDALKKYLTAPQNCAYHTIYDATQYSAMAGGKRLRPMLLLEFCQVCGGDVPKALPFAVALEMIHTYSLIHDDLPCMDNDDLRRGKPTNHKVYGEAIAVLAGDALLTRAFEIILDPRNTGSLPPANIIASAAFLARAAGMDGMVGGQVLDLEAENQQLELEPLMQLQQLKTGYLIQAACVIGCTLAGRGDEKTIRAAEIYGTRLGLAFQITDDILDIEGDAQTLGKTTGKDEKSGKSTFPKLLGIDECRELVDKLSNEAVHALGIFSNTEFLSQIVKELSNRKK